MQEGAFCQTFGCHKTMQKIRQDNNIAPYFEDYVNTVVNVHINNTEIEVK
jgi:hypothetical protein